MDSKLPDVGTSIFAVMSKMAADSGAINLAQGFPDFSPPDELVDSVCQHMRSGKNQYAPMSGIPALREAIAAKVDQLYGAQVDADTQVTVTTGATEALMVAITCTVRPDDEVIIFDPAYDAYAPAVALAGGRSVHLRLSPPDYGIDFNAVADAINDKTRLIIINSPHNPTGSIIGASALDQLAALIRDREIYVISDEVYEHMVFDGETHASVLGHQELRERSFAIFSFGKTYHNTGWKVGYCVAPALMTEEFRKVHQYTTFCTSTPMQFAIADYMGIPDNHHHLELADFYQRKRDYFQQAMAQSKWEILPCNGTYFQLLRYADISGMPDTEFSAHLTREHGVASIPISVFYADRTDDHVLRICFAKSEATLDDAAQVLTGLG